MWRRKSRRSPQRILFLFVDGVGIRAPGPDNPINRENCPTLCELCEKHGVPIDATLGVPGVPQSATGQASIFCGVNAAREVGRHVPGFPGPHIREIIQRNNIFMELSRRGIPCKFGNAYYVSIPPDMKNRRFLSVTTVMALSVPESLHFKDAPHAHRAAAEDIIRAGIRDRAYMGPQIDPANAAEHLFELSQDYPFVLFEYFQTDRTGHGKSPEQVVDVLRICDIFLKRLLKRLKRSRTLLVVTSDHGNLEDVSVRTHTLNPVPLIACGPGEEEFRRGITSLCDIMPRIVETLKGKE